MSSSIDRKAMNYLSDIVEKDREEVQTTLPDAAKSPNFMDHWARLEQMTWDVLPLTPYSLRSLSPAPSSRTQWQ